MHPIPTSTGVSDFHVLEKAWSISGPIFSDPPLSGAHESCLVSDLGVRRFVPESAKPRISSESDSAALAPLLALLAHIWSPPPTVGGVHKPGHRGDPRVQGRSDSEARACVPPWLRRHRPGHRSPETADHGGRGQEPDCSPSGSAGAAEGPSRQPGRHQLDGSWALNGTATRGARDGLRRGGRTGSQNSSIAGTASLR